MSIKKGLSIFLFLSAAVSGAVLFFSIDTTSFDIFRQADLWKIGVAMLLVIAVWLLDAFKLIALTRAAGERISFDLAIELTWINYFGAAITPMQSGGGPFQMYIMYQNGISVGKSVAITLVRTILTMLILGLAIPFALMLRSDLPVMSGWGMRGFVFYVIAFVTIAWFCVMLSLARPKLVKRFFGIVVVFFRKVGMLKPERVNALLRRVNSEIDAYNQNVWAFMTTGRRYFFMGTCCAVLQLLAQLSVMPCMIWAIGMPVMYVECVLLQALFLFLLYFIPTPGGSGVAEGGAALVFAVFVPRSVAGMLGVGWRFLTEHTGIILGAIVALKLIGWNLANQIMTKEEQEKKDKKDKSDGHETGVEHDETPPDEDDLS